MTISVTKEKVFLSVLSRMIDELFAKTRGLFGKKHFNYFSTFLNMNATREVFVYTRFFAKD